MEARGTCGVDSMGDLAGGRARRVSWKGRGVTRSESIWTEGDGEDSEEGDNPPGGDDGRGDSDEGGDSGEEQAEGGGKTGGGSVGRVRK